MSEENYMTLFGDGKLAAAKFPASPPAMQGNGEQGLINGNSKGISSNSAFKATALFEGSAGKAKVDDLEAAIFCAPWFCH